MKILFCLIIAFAAATIVQANHWSNILRKADKEKKRYFFMRHFILSGAFIVGSTLLGLIPTAIPNDLLAYAFAGFIGFAPLPAIKAILQMSKAAKLPLGHEPEPTAPASLREFLEA